VKTRIFSLIITLIMVVAALTSCSDGWKGYYDTDLENFVRVSDYNGVVVNISKYTDEVTDEEIEKYISSKLQENAVRSPITDRVSKKGDYADISFTVTVGGKAWDELAADSVVLTVYGNELSDHIAGLSELIAGRKAGDTFEFTTPFPEDYVNPEIKNAGELAGKNVTFHVTVSSVFEYSIPELTDALVAEKLSDTAKTVDEYKAEVKKALLAAKIESNAINIRKDIWYRVVNTSEVINYPKSLIKEQKNNLLKEVEYNAELYGMTLKQYIAAVGLTEEKLDEQLEESAKSTVKSYLVMYYIAKAENITVSSEEYASGLNELYKSYKGEYATLEEFENHFGKEQIERSILNDKVVEYIYSVSGVRKS